MSRFDLVFVLLDRPGAELDFCLSEKILTRNSGIKSIKELQREASSASTFLQSTSIDQSQLLPTALLRQYISYAQQSIHPRLSPEAAQALKAFFLSARDRKEGDALPVTTRQLESAVRLAEARAKAELRFTVTLADAEEVIDML